MLTLRQIEVIRAIVVTGSVGGAARLLNVSSPGISRVMKHAEGNQSRAAEWLGINRNTLRRKLVEHKLIK